MEISLRGSGRYNFWNYCFRHCIARIPVQLISLWIFHLLTYLKHENCWFISGWHGFCWIIRREETSKEVTQQIPQFEFVFSPLLLVDCWVISHSSSLRQASITSIHSIEPFEMYDCLNQIIPSGQAHVAMRSLRAPQAKPAVYSNASDGQIVAWRRKSSCNGCMP